MNRNLLLALLLVLFCRPVFAQDLSQLTKQKPFAIGGSLSANADFYNITGRESTRDPFSYTLSGNVNVSLYSLQLPFSFVYSNRNFNYSQPFNRFGISPEYKWIKVHLGYRSMSFSPLTMAGHSFLGVGVELNPGLFRFGALYGRFSQKTLPNSTNPQDTIQTPVRKGYSMKVGVGSTKNFADLIFLQIMDDTLSFDKMKFGSKIPQANTVLGTHMKFTLFKNVTWETEGAVSLLTKDLNTTQPIETGNATLQSLVGTFHVNLSSEYSTGVTSSLTYAAKKFSLGLQYRRLDPNFQSFGAYYFNTDVENMTINSKFRLFKNKISVSGNVGLQNDNLRKNKEVKSSRLISMANITYNSGKLFSLNGSFSNYSINQLPGRLPLNDTIKLYQSNRNITITPTFTFNHANNQQMVQLNLVLMDLTDHNQFTAKSTEVNSRMALLNYFFSHNKSGLSVMAGVNYTTMTSVYSNQILYGINTDIGKPFFKGKLSTHGGISVNHSSINGTPGLINTGTASVTFKPGPKHLFRMNFCFMQNIYPETSSIKSFHETKFMFSYVYNI